jgi:hypothetical protein
MDEDAANPSRDVVLLSGTTEDGEGLRALRSRPGRLDLAEIRPVSEGQHIGESELISLHPRQIPILCDVKVHYDPEQDGPQDSPHAGPARVASRAYRQNWDQVFGQRILN